MSRFGSVVRRGALGCGARLAAFGASALFLCLVDRGNYLYSGPSEPVFKINRPPIFNFTASFGGARVSGTPTAKAF